MTGIVRWPCLFLSSKSMTETGKFNTSSVISIIMSYTKLTSTKCTTSEFPHWMQSGGENPVKFWKLRLKVSLVERLQCCSNLCVICRVSLGLWGSGQVIFVRSGSKLWLLRTPGCNNTATRGCKRMQRFQSSPNCLLFKLRNVVANVSIFKLLTRMF